MGYLSATERFWRDRYEHYLDDGEPPYKAAHMADEDWRSIFGGEEER